jgi:hypothetical protein
MKKLLILCLGLAAQHFTAAQSDTTLRFLNGNLEYCNDKEAIFRTRCVTQPLDDGRYMVRDFNFRTGKLIQTYYLSPDSINRTGPFVALHENGSTWTKGQYTGGKKTGSWKKWHINGTLGDSSFYNQNGNITGSSKNWYNDGKIRDTAFYHPDSAGRAYMKQFFEDGKLAGEGPVINDGYEGYWKFYHPNGKLSTEEIYVDGNLNRIKCYNEDGTLSTVECQPAIDAEFPGGMAKWQMYISGALGKKSRELSRKDISGTSVIGFAIDVDGKVTDLKVITSARSELDQYALDIIKGSPAWKPAKEHNRLVKAFRLQPVTFRLE